MMYLTTVRLDEKDQINELKNQYEGKVKAVNDDISSLWERLDPSSHSKRMDDIRASMREKEDERESYYDVIASLDYAIKCIDYVKMTKDLMYREPITRDVWKKDKYDT